MKEESFKDEQGRTHTLTYLDNGVLDNESIIFNDEQGNLHQEEYKNNKLDSRCIRYPNGQIFLELYDDKGELIDLSYRDENRKTTVLWVRGKPTETTEK